MKETINKKIKKEHGSPFVQKDCRFYLNHRIKIPEPIGTLS